MLEGSARLLLTVTGCVAALAACSDTSDPTDISLNQSSSELLVSEPDSPLSSIAPSESERQGLNTTPDIGGAFLPDYSYAGYGFGLELIPNFSNAQVVKASEYGVIADDGKDDSLALIDTLDVARDVTGRVVVQLPRGRVVLSSILPIDRSNIVLRGMGAGESGTDIFIPRPLNLIDTGSRFDEIREYLVLNNKLQKEPDRNVLWPFSEYSWTGGFLWVAPEGHRAAPYLIEKDVPDPVLAMATSGQRGETSLSVDDATSLQAGDDIEIVWFNRAGDSGPLLNEMYGDTDVKIGSHHWSFPDRGLVRQKTVITSIDGGKVRLADTLLHNISKDVPASVVDWEPLTDVGIEDLRITFPKGDSFGHHLEQGFNGIYFTGTRNGWVRDVMIENADSGILSYSSGNLTFDNIQTRGDRLAHYSVHAGSVHNVLVSDLEVHNPVRHPLSVNTQSTRTVFLRSEVHRQPTFDQHAGSNHQNLFDSTIFHVDVINNLDNDAHAYPIWNGSGAGYWQPGHGRYNTTYNLEVRVESGVGRDERLILQGLDEGPQARLIGLWGNRKLDVDYRPEPIIYDLNIRPDPPSLYEHQLSVRRDE